MDFDFKFQPQYIGLWYLDDSHSEELSGTLFVEEQTMWIDLFFQDNKGLVLTEIDTLYGTTYTFDEQKNKETTINIVLQHLYFLKSTQFGNGLSHYKYEVKEFFIYEGVYEKDDIREISIRASIFDKWTSDILSKSFQGKDIDNMPDNQRVINYVQPHPYFLNKKSEIKIYLYFGYSCNYSGECRYIKQKTSFCIRPIDHQSFDKAIALVKRYCWILYLLMNRIFQTDYVVMYTTNGKYIYRLSNKYAYHFVEDKPNARPYTFLKDFSTEEIMSIFSKWDDFYIEYQDAIDMFFETASNLYLPPSSIIRNYISIIDALSKLLKGEICEINHKTKKEKFVLEILETTKDILTARQKNKMKTLFLPNKGTEMKSRFRKLLEQIKDLMPEEINSEFVEKIVNTRNNITHPNDYEPYSFPKEQYENVSYKLSKVIRAYILKNLGVNDTITKKLIAF